MKTVLFNFMKTQLTKWLQTSTATQLRISLRQQNKPTSNKWIKLQAIH